MRYPTLFNKQGGSAIGTPHPLRVLLAIALTSVVGAHAIHYGSSTHYEAGAQVRRVFFFDCTHFSGDYFISLLLTIAYVWYVLYLQLNLRTALQYVIGGVVLAVVLVLGGEFSSTGFLVMFGVAITINSWLFYLFAFYGVRLDDGEKVSERAVNPDAMKGEEAFAAGRYDDAIDSFASAVEEGALSQRHMAMYLQAQRSSRSSSAKQ